MTRAALSYARRGLPVLPPWAFGRHAPRLAGYGYEPIPIVPAQKRPPFEGWQAGGDVAGWLPRYARCSIGILTRTTPALDIDATNGALADDIQALADRVLGDAPVRYGQRPKRLMPFRIAADPFSKVRLAWTLNGEAGAAEVLANGQQFVGLGRHPAGHAYAWERDPDLDIPHGLLPPLDQARAVLFLRTLAAVLRRLGAADLKAAGWELEERPARREPSRRRYAAANDDAPPWHRYSARELACLVDPDGVHEYRGWWRCRCPAHSGVSHTSLVIRRAEDGRPGWHCFAGCADRDVAREIARIAR